MAIQITTTAQFDDSWTTMNQFFNYADGFFTDTDYNENVGEFAGTENPDPIVDLGWFWSLFGTFSGTQYVLEGEANGENLGFIIQAADGSYLDYTFFAGPTHTLYGEIGSITFGRGLVEGADGEFSFTEELVSIDGLDTVGLNAGVNNGAVIDRNDANLTNDTHEIVNGLMNSDLTGLIDALVNNGNVNLDDDVTGSSAAADLPLVA